MSAFTAVLRSELHFCYQAMDGIYRGMEDLRDILEDDRLSDNVRFAIRRIANRSNMKIIDRMFHRNNIAAKAVYREEEELNALLLLQHLIENKSRSYSSRVKIDSVWRDEAENELYCLQQLAQSLLDAYNTIGNDLLEPQGRSNRVLTLVKRAIKNRRLLKDLIIRCEKAINAILFG